MKRECRKTCIREGSEQNAGMPAPRSATCGTCILFRGSHELLHGSRRVLLSRRLVLVWTIITAEKTFSEIRSYGPPCC